MFNKSFRSKIIFPTLIVLTVLVVVLIISFSSKFLYYNNSIINETINANINSIKFYLNTSKNNSKTAAISMAFNINSIKAIKERDRDEILRIFTPMPDLYRITYYTICDNAGIVLARTYQPELFGDSILNQQNVQDALDGKVGSYFESGTEIKVAVRTGAPVYDADGALIGVVSAGVRFDLDSEVDELKNLLNSELTVFYGDTRIATTIKQNGQRAKATALEPAIAKIVIDDRQEYFGNEDIFGTEYRAFYTPLLNAKNEAFATFSLGIPLEKLKNASNVLVRDGIIIGVIGLSISIILLLVIISSISKPLVMLAKDMDNVACGTLHVNTNIKSDDEVGLLNKSLHGAVNIIYKLIEDITATIAEHKKGNIDYFLDTEVFPGDYKTLADNIVTLASVGMKDQLTKLPNRHSFDNRLNLEWQRAIREKTALSILLIDVDRFKNYNDSYGHQQGDVALQTVAGVFAQSLNRAVDFAARWGGEEFVVLLPGTTADGALKVAEKIRAKVENMMVPCADEGAAKVTVSLGVNTQMPTSNSLTSDFISKADEALYRAKKAGRNRIVQDR
ncbi:MAG: diguanylate cyclase [Desulfovibrionaceae bacterium]|nr:diguanylate cyclase [Desulfovibrionaceae bacterium]